jgi:hypothetical protein
MNKQTVSMLAVDRTTAFMSREKTRKNRSARESFCFSHVYSVEYKNYEEIQQRFACDKKDKGGRLSMRKFDRTQFRIRYVFLPMCCVVVLTQGRQSAMV